MPGSEDMVDEDGTASMGPATQEMVKHVQHYTQSKVQVALDQRQADWGSEREDLQNIIQKLQAELKESKTANTSRTASLGSSLSGSPSKQATNPVPSSTSRTEKKLQKELDQLRFENTRLKKKYDGVVSALESNIAKHELERNTWRRCKKAMHRVMDQNPSVGDAFIKAERELDEEEARILNDKIQSGKSTGRKRNTKEFDMGSDDGSKASSGRTTPTRLQPKSTDSKEQKATLPGTRKPLRTPTKRSSASRTSPNHASNATRSSDLSDIRPAGQRTTPQKTARAQGPLSSIPWANRPQATAATRSDDLQRTPPTIRRNNLEPLPPAPDSNSSDLHLANIAYAEQNAEDDLPLSARKPLNVKRNEGDEGDLAAMMEAEMQWEQEELDQMSQIPPGTGDVSPKRPFPLSPLRVHPPRSEGNSRSSGMGSEQSSMESSVDLRIQEAMMDDEERHRAEEQLSAFEHDMVVDQDEDTGTRQDEEGPIQRSSSPPPHVQLLSQTVPASGIPHLFPLPKAASFNPPAELEIIDESLPRYKQLKRSAPPNPSQTNNITGFKRISGLAALGQAKTLQYAREKQNSSFRVPPPRQPVDSSPRQASSPEAKAKALDFLNSSSQSRTLATERRKTVEQELLAFQQRVWAVDKPSDSIKETKEVSVLDKKEGEEVQEKEQNEPDEMDIGSNDEREQRKDAPAPSTWRGYVSRARASSSPQKAVTDPSPPDQRKASMAILPSHYNDEEMEHDDSATETSSIPASSAPSAAQSPERVQASNLHTSSATIREDPVSPRKPASEAYQVPLQAVLRSPEGTARAARDGIPSKTPNVDGEKQSIKTSIAMPIARSPPAIIATQEPLTGRTQTSTATARTSTYARSRVFDPDTDAPAKLLSEDKLPPRKEKQKPESTGNSRLPPVPSLPFEMCSVAPMIEELRSSTSAKPKPSDVDSSYTPQIQCRKVAERFAIVEPASGTPLWVHPENKKRRERQRGASTAIDNATPGASAGNAPDSGVVLSRNKSTMPRGKIGAASVVKRIAELQHQETGTVRKGADRSRPDANEEEEVANEPIRALSLPKKADRAGTEMLERTPGHENMRDDGDDPFMETSEKAIQSKKKCKAASADQSRPSAAAIISALASPHDLAAVRPSIQATARSVPVTTTEKSSIPIASSSSKPAGKKRKARNGVALPDDIEDDLSAVGKVILNARGTPAGRYFSYGDDEDAPPAKESTDSVSGLTKQLNVDQALAQLDKKRQRDTAGIVRTASTTQSAYKRKHDASDEAGTSAAGSTKKAKRENKEAEVNENTPTQPKAVVEEKEKDYSEAHQGQDFLRDIHRRRKQELRDDPYKYKTGAMYAPQLAGALAAKNLARIEVNPDLNNGVPYAYQEVVRNKDARKQMHGVDCDCCSGYYEHRVRHMPLEQRRDAANKIIADSSRHRQQFEAPPTPPSYWQMGFPNSPEVEKIKRKAEKMEEEKRAKMEAEANRCDGRFRYKPN